MLHGNPLFDKTVTVYRLVDGAVERQVLENCYFTWKDILVEDEVGIHMDRDFLLIVPGPSQKVFTGCRVLPGSGPRIDAQQWQNFIPATVDGLCQVSCVSLKHLFGTLSHTEASRK